MFRSRSRGVGGNDESQTKRMDAYKTALGIFLFAIMVQFISLGWVIGPGILIAKDTPLTEHFSAGAETDFTWISAIVVCALSLFTVVLHLFARGSVSKARSECQNDQKESAGKSAEGARNIYIGAAVSSVFALLLSLVVLIVNIVWWNEENGENDTRALLFGMNTVVVSIILFTTFVIVAVVIWVLLHLRDICNKKKKSQAAAQRYNSQNGPNNSTNTANNYQLLRSRNTT